MSTNNGRKALGQSNGSQAHINIIQMFMPVELPLSLSCFADREDALSL